MPVSVSQDQLLRGHISQAQGNVAKTMEPISLIFVFEPVQRNWACFTWKGALEICSLLLLLLSRSWSWCCHRSKWVSGKQVLLLSVQSWWALLLLFLYLRLAHWFFKIWTVSSFSPLMVIPVLMPLAMLVISFVFSTLISMLKAVKLADVLN